MTDYRNGTLNQKSDAWFTPENGDTIRTEIAVIGGGASGCMAAIGAAESGASVVVFDKNDRPARKICATGNGRCNLVNLYQNEKCWYTSSGVSVRERLASFSERDLLAFFEERGIWFHDRQGYVYPGTDQASVIADLLIREMNRLQVGVFSGTRVTGIEKDPSGAFRITVESVGGSDPGKEKNNRNRRKKEDPHKSGRNRYDRNRYDRNRYDRDRNLKTESVQEIPEHRICIADRVILCTGGLAGPVFGCGGDGYALAESLGHSLVPTVPALTPLICPEKALKMAAGVRCPAAITLICDGEETGAEQGELQITETAVSGIPVFQLSRLAGYALREGREVRVRADFLPGMPEEEWQKHVDLRLRDDRNQTLEQLFMGLVHPKLLRFILNRLGLVSEQKRAGVKTEQIRQVLQLMRGLDFEITDLAGYEKAQVTAGGIPLTETDPDTMESLACPGLYLAGELLDADGICGGYNLQWAMTGGLLAGRAAAGKMNREVNHEV